MYNSAITMCFRRPRRSKASASEDVDLLAPRPVTSSKAEFKDNHNARIFEAHLDHQRQISAALEELDTEGPDHQTSPDDIDPNICAWNRPPSIAVTQSQPHICGPPSRASEVAEAPPSIMLNGDETPNISLLGLSKQRDAWTLSRLTGTLPTPSKSPSPKSQQKYDILPSRPRPSDPPDLRYENYEIWDEVQKENFDLGGPDLTWKTGVVDLKIEAELLQDYINWVRDCRSDLRSEGSLIKQDQIHGAKPGSEGYKKYKMGNRKDREFIGRLEYELRKEIKAVAIETNEHDERYGKDFVDRNVVWKVVERLEREEVERRREREMRMGS